MRSPTDPSTATEWVVVLEFLADSGNSTVGTTEVLALIAQLATCRPITVHEPNRYVVQMHVSATDPIAALDAAVGAHRRAAQGASLGHVPLVRADVMTPAELDRDVAALTDLATDWDGATFNRN